MTRNQMVQLERRLNMLPTMVNEQVPSPCTLFYYTPVRTLSLKPIWKAVAGFAALVLIICVCASLTWLTSRPVNRRWGFELHVHHQMWLVVMATLCQARMRLAGFTGEVKSAAVNVKCIECIHTVYIYKTIDKSGVSCVYVWVAEYESIASPRLLDL